MKRARTLELEALGLEPRPRFDHLRWRTLNALGLIALDENRNAAAATLFADALTSARAASDEEGIAKIGGNIALAAGNLGDLITARAGHRAQRAAGRRLGNAVTEANGLANEALVDIWEGDPYPAIARLDSARLLYARANYSAGQLNALRQGATAFELLGQYARAFSALDSALVLARRDHSVGEEAESLRLLATLHQTVGDFRQAARLYRQAETISRKTGIASNLASILRGAAAADLAMQELVPARLNANSALQLHRESDEPLDELDDLLLIAALDERSGDRDAATRRLEEANALAARIGSRGARATAALAAAAVAEADHNPRVTLATLRRIDSTTLNLDFAVRWQAEALAARAWARLARFDSAAAAGSRAVAALAIARGRIPSDALRDAFAANSADVYGDLTLVLLRLGRTDDAFATADAAHGGGILERLGALRRETAQGDDSSLVRGKELLRRIDMLMEQLRQGRGTRPPDRGPELADSADAETIAQLSAARDEYEALIGRALNGGSHSDKGPATATLDVARVRESLAPEERLVEYLVTRDEILIFVVDQNHVQVARSAFRANTLVERARLLHDLWGSTKHDWESGLAIARALDETLIAPIRKVGMLRGVSRLFVVPHGILGQLPFSALQDGTSRHFLIDDVTLTMLPAAAALPILRQSRTDGAPTANATGFAPYDRELIASTSEISALGEYRTNPTLIVGRQATERALRSALGSGGIVHVATHGALNARNPMFSRLDLVPSPLGGPRDDGRLEVHELQSVIVRSPLVFISGCETGAWAEWSADPVRGTADVTLAQAFIAAGARNVISTLWRIDDVGASALARAFYARLSRLSVSDALAAAQRDLSRQKKYANPYYWAGFTLSGGGELYQAAQSGAKTSVSLKK